MKQPPPESIQRVAKMTFASVYPHYVSKIEKKNRTIQELHQVIKWLTGYDDQQIESLIKDKVTFDAFVENATWNPNAHLITGTICGYKVQDIENEFMRRLRYLDKVVDELAKGKKIEQILRDNASQK